MLAAFLIATALLSTDAWQAPMPRHGALGHLRAGRMARMQVEGAGIEPALNVLGSALESCCSNVRDTGIGTGFYRDGFCSTGMMVRPAIPRPTLPASNASPLAAQDEGRHTACVEVSAAFLAFSKDAGNDLSSPAPQYMFPVRAPAVAAHRYRSPASRSLAD